MMFVKNVVEDIVTMRTNTEKKEMIMIEIGSNLTELLKYIVMVVGIVLVIYFMVTNL